MSVGGRAPALDAAALEWIAAALRGSAESTVSQATHGHYSRVYAWQIATNLGSGHRLSKSSR
jgi:hypothetical protein